MYHRASLEKSPVGTKYWLKNINRFIEAPQGRNIISMLKNKIVTLIILSSPIVHNMF